MPSILERKRKSDQLEGYFTLTDREGGTKIERWTDCYPILQHHSPTTKHLYEGQRLWTTSVLLLLVVVPRIQICEEFVSGMLLCPVASCHGLSLSLSLWIGGSGSGVGVVRLLLPNHKSFFQKKRFSSSLPLHLLGSSIWRNLASSWRLRHPAATWAPVKIHIFRERAASRESKNASGNVCQLNSAELKIWMNRNSSQWEEWFQVVFFLACLPSSIRTQHSVVLYSQVRF